MSAIRTVLPLVLLTLSLNAASAADYFLRGYYKPVTGKVGQQLSSDANFEITDLPDRCVVEWKDIVIDGTLPPGLDIANSFSSIIAGTPTQAGDWPVTVTFHQIGCSTIPAGRVDRAIKVNFHITP